jgi:hypothetical protein
MSAVIVCLLPPYGSLLTFPLSAHFGKGTEFICEVEVLTGQFLIMRMMVSGGHLLMVISAQNLTISKLYFVALHYVTFQQVTYSIRNIKNIRSMKGRN